MKRFLLKIVGYGFIAFCCVNIIAFASLYSLRKSSFYKPLFVSNHIQQSFDYVVLGSSTGLTTLNTKQIDSITGFSGLNISIDDTSLSTHYLMLKHFIEIGKKSKRCVLALGHGDVGNDTPKLSGNDYRFLPFVNKPYVQEYYSGFETREAQILKNSTYFPFLGVSYYNAEIFYPSLMSILNPLKRNRFDSRGNYVYPVNKGAKERIRKEVQLEIKNPYLKKIERLCAENDIELILYHPPLYKRTIVPSGLSYRFINHSSILDNPDLFYDNIHVNKKGRRLASQAFAFELKQ